MFRNLGDAVNCTAAGMRGRVGVRAQYGCDYLVEWLARSSAHTLRQNVVY